jgi:Zn-dependent metalloprotease
MCHPICFIAPPNILDYIAKEGDADQRDAALRTLATSASLRTRRSLVGPIVQKLGVDAVVALGLIQAPTGVKRSVYDVQHGGQSALPGTLVRGENDPAVDDASVNEAFDGAGATADFYLDVFGRKSIDDKEMELVSSVHYGVRFENALWNGAQMIYGDGGGQLFVENSLTTAIDVIGHELTHGVTQFTAGLVYSKDSGALNESISDVFGSLVKQYSKQQEAGDADWLIGEGLLVPRLGEALRSMKAPGTAWIGDNQPSTMAGHLDLPDDNDPAHDNGGVHINSGIPNHAFYLAATAIGGYAWEKAGKIWYGALTRHLQPHSQFRDAADATVAVAEELFGAGAERDAVAQAWTDVGVLP